MKRAVDDGAWYVPGLGKAHRNTDHYSRPFNCRMVGTFNVRSRLTPSEFRPALTDYDGYHRFWLCKINDIFYGWVMRWDGSAKADGDLEIITKAPLPSRLKSGAFKVELLERWPEHRIKSYGAKIKSFQGFDWTTPRRADSELVWKAIAGTGVSFSGKSVLDVGCNYGYHSFRASKAGAEVVGYDKNSNVIAIAREINDHVEMADVDFCPEQMLFFDSPPAFDVVLCLSVLHQSDPDYSRLEERIGNIRALARERAFVELIVPSLDGRMSEAEVDRIMGSSGLLKYKHRVRRERKIYEVKNVNI